MNLENAVGILSDHVFEMSMFAVGLEKIKLCATPSVGIFCETLKFHVVHISMGKHSNEGNVERSSDCYESLSKAVDRFNELSYRIARR